MILKHVETSLSSYTNKETQNKIVRRYF